jgi:WD40 repeat protein
MDAPYRQTHRLRYPKGFFGFPCIVAKGTGEAVVSDWSGNLTLLDLHRKAVVKSENVSWMLDGQPLGCQTLASLDLQPELLRWCAVATRGGYAALWNPDSSEVVKIHPERGGSVNAVAFSPDGTRLALGTGLYNLTPGRAVRANIEVWSLSDGEPTHLMSTTLPGICVDRIHWDTSLGQIVCTSGDESQEFGHLCCLDGDSLRADCLDRVPLVGVARVLATWDTCLVVHRDGIHAYDRQDFNLKWSHTESVERADLAYDETTDLLFHSAGTALSLDGEVVGRIEMPEGVSCLTPKPYGGFLCVSKTGVVSTWEPDESYQA